MERIRPTAGHCPECGEASLELVSPISIHEPAIIAWNTMTYPNRRVQVHTTAAHVGGMIACALCEYADEVPPDLRSSLAGVS